jgi:hypothetical protein
MTDGLTRLKQDLGKLRTHTFEVTTMPNNQIEAKPTELKRAVERLEMVNPGQGMKLLNGAVQAAVAGCEINECMD